MERAANKLGLRLERDAELKKVLHARGLKADARRLGTIGSETVVAIGPLREGGNVVMGAHGRLGSAAKAIRCLTATGAQGIIQVGIAFGASRDEQTLGDVLVSASLSPYDNRTVRPRAELPGYVNDYSEMRLELPSPVLLERFRRERQRTKFGFEIHIGAMLSGAARILCAAYRDELLKAVPRGNEKFVGGEMEGVGLLSGSVRADDPVWCVVKGISDFADENRDHDIEAGREKAAYNAAFFVLSSLLNDAKELAERGET